MKAILFLATITLSIIMLSIGDTITYAQGKNLSENKNTTTTQTKLQAKQQKEAKNMSGDKTLPEYIGTGELQHNGTIVLHLTREEAGRRFHDELHYGPNDPNYASIKKHIGPVKENEVFSVKPFSDEKDK